MNNNYLNFLIRPLIVMTIISIVLYLRSKLSKPKVENKEQKPGKLQKIALAILIAITVVFALMAVLGLVMNEFEMAIVSSILTLVMIAISVYVKYALKTSYQENTEYIILKSKNKESKVFYKDIVDWKTSLNEIIVFDGSGVDNKGVKINIVFFKPEILLRTIADMTFEGKFQDIYKNSIKDPNREKEIVNFLVGSNYGYLIEDYIEEIKLKKKMSY